MGGISRRAQPEVDTTHFLCEKIRNGLEERVTWTEILLRGSGNPLKRPWYLFKVKDEKALGVEDGA